MGLTMLAVLQQAAEEQPLLSDIIQAMLLAIMIVFVFSVLAAGFTAKRINNIHEPSYSKAFGATLLKNLFGWSALALFGFYFDAPLVVTLIVAMAIVPMIAYKFVFSCMWREAALIWIGAFVVEVAVGYVLTLVGLVEFVGLVNSM
jgi:hypothetical protein